MIISTVQTRFSMVKILNYLGKSVYSMQRRYFAPHTRSSPPRKVPPRHFCTPPPMMASRSIEHSSPACIISVILSSSGAFLFFKRPIAASLTSSIKMSPCVHGNYLLVIHPTCIVHRIPLTIQIFIILLPPVFDICRVIQ